MSRNIFTNTPEALLGRNDSKNPAKTCKGLTSSGRPCRRALASPKLSPIGARMKQHGVVAVIEEDGDVTEADFYCWQHKDQAKERVQQGNDSSAGIRRKRSAKLYPLQERSSIDTLVQKLGIDAVPDDRRKAHGENHRYKRSNSVIRPPKKTKTRDFANLPQTSHMEKHNVPQRPARKTPRKKSGFWASLCCTVDDEDDYVEIVRHRKRTEQTNKSSSSPEVRPSPRVSYESRPTNASIPPRNSAPSGLHPRPASQQRVSSNSQTNHLLSLIPQHCSPSTTSALLAELIRPISAADEEGYIYIFWLTPQTKDAPAESTARSLLAPPEKRPHHTRRISDVITEYSFDGTEENRPDRTGARSKDASRTIMLKIGRANNVTRRMNEWQRQCGFKLNLVRWYPYISSSSTQSPRPSQNGEQVVYPDLSRPPAATSRQSELVKKIPCVKRVERLVHLELAEKQTKRRCETCGKEHREWFEVEASQAGVKLVDECVRRWVGWAEMQAS